MPMPSFYDHPRCYRCPCTVEHKLAGIRHDAYANAHRIQPEIAKSAVDTAMLPRQQLSRLRAVMPR